MCQAQRWKRPCTYHTEVQDLRPGDCCGSSQEGEDSEEDTGEDTYVHLINLAMMMMTVTLKVMQRNGRLHYSDHVPGDSRPSSADTWVSNPMQLQIYNLTLSLLPLLSSNLMFCFETNIVNCFIPLYQCSKIIFSLLSLLGFR